jgi:RNA polymerase sigma factor (sigma-70 family)
MASRQGSAVARVIHTIASEHHDELVSDRELLLRFVEKRDQHAFTTLVRRHGAMVLGVAERVLRHRQDAEDVCQATFLLLARKAAITAWRDSIANWLYETARHLSLKALTSARRRHIREANVAPRTPPDPLAAITARDLESILDAELNRLAVKYRTPLILCCLEGKTRDEAARCLGVPLSTVISRLEEGRALLRRRLARRGVPLALALGGATLCSGTASASVPVGLAQALGESAGRILAGEVIGHVASIQVATLVKGAMHAMAIAKLKFIAACMLAATVVGFVAWAVFPSTAQEPTGALRALLGPDDKHAAKKNQAAGPGTLLLTRRDGMITLTPDGKQEADVTSPKGTRGNLQGRLSPDGTHIAYIVTVDGGLRPPRREGEVPEPWPFKVVVGKVGAADPVAVTAMPAYRLDLSWAPDGKRLLLTKQTDTDANIAFETVLLDPQTGKTESLDLAAGVRVLDWSRDGKNLLVVHRQDKKYRLGLVTKDEKEVRDLTELHGWSGDNLGRFAPDGSRVLYTDADPADKDAHRWGLSSRPYVFSVAGKKREPLVEFPENAQVVGIAWSPDGKRVAYAWKQLHAELLKKDTLNVNEIGIATEAFLMIADADGRNARTVVAGKADNAINMIFGSIDWR